METSSLKGYIKLSKTPLGIMDYTGEVDTAFHKPFNPPFISLFNILF